MGVDVFRGGVGDNVDGDSYVSIFLIDSGLFISLVFLY